MLLGKVIHEYKIIAEGIKNVIGESSTAPVPFVVWGKDIDDSGEVFSGAYRSSKREAFETFSVRECGVPLKIQ